MPEFRIQLDVVVEAENEQAAIDKGNAMLQMLSETGNTVDHWAVDEADPHTKEA